MRKGIWAFGAIAATLALAPAASSAATIPVTTTVDELDVDLSCSLREAVQSARDNGTDTTGCANGELAETDTIILGPSTYTLAVLGNGEDVNQTGDLDFAGGDVVVRGAGQGLTTVTQSVNDRIFDASPAASRTLTLEALTVDGGNTTLLLDDEARGGNVRMRSGGHLVVRDARITSGFARVGAGIYATGDTGDVTITDSRIDTNQAQVFGGGINSGSALDVRITRSSIDLNEASGSGLQLLGGGISSLAESVNGGSMEITDSVISGNKVLNAMNGGKSVGGGIRARALTVRGSLISGNSANSVGPEAQPQNGGGIWLEGGTVSVANSTLYNNEAGSDPGDDGYGGAVYADAGTVSLEHITFAANSARQDGDTLATGIGAGGGISVGRSIIGGTVFAGTRTCEPGTLPIASSGFNASISTDPGCGFGASDSTGASTGIGSGPPQDNGGPTPTMRIQSAPALDKVPAAECGPAGGIDQRGFYRPAGAGCDAGAYERVICNGIVQEGPGAVDCPPVLALPPAGGATPAAPCAGLRGKKRKRCLCKQKKSKKKRKKCLKKLKGRKRS